MIAMAPKTATQICMEILFGVAISSSEDESGGGCFFSLPNFNACARHGIHAVIISTDDLIPHHHVSTNIDLLRIRIDPTANIGDFLCRADRYLTGIALWRQGARLGFATACPNRSRY